MKDVWVHTAVFLVPYFVLISLTGNDYVEGAPLKPCADLVIQSRRERREREETELAIKLAMERRKNKGDNDSDSDESEKGKKVVVKKDKQKHVFEKRQ